MIDGKWFIVGGAGFIGSHFLDRLLGTDAVDAVTIYDNFTSGRAWHHDHHADDPRFRVVRADVHDAQALHESMVGHDVVIHLASNPDIAAAMTDPTSTSARARCSRVGRRGDAQRRRAHDPLRLGQRRLRRSRRARGRGGLRADDPGVHLRRQQARR